MWLDPVRAVLDAAQAPIDLFFRDDDAGWDDPRLVALLDVFERPAVPLDLAIIPQALTASLADTLLERARIQPLAFHQHGFAHANHELEGRKCEFGPSRAPEQQYRDIAQGRRRLREHLGDASKPMFTPPWNRCTAATIRALHALSFALLSRDYGAAPLALDGLHELSVGVDWCRYSADSLELGARLAVAIGRCRPAGIMLHHAVMSDGDLERLCELLYLLRRNDSARCHLMTAFVPTEMPDARDVCAR